MKSKDGSCCATYFVQDVLYAMHRYTISYAFNMLGARTEFGLVDIYPFSDFMPWSEIRSV